MWRMGKCSNKSEKVNSCSSFFSNSARTGPTPFRNSMGVDNMLEDPGIDKQLSNPTKLATYQLKLTVNYTPKIFGIGKKTGPVIP